MRTTKADQNVRMTRLILAVAISKFDTTLFVEDIYEVASDNQAQFVIFIVHSVQNDAVSTFCVVVVCKIHENKGIKATF